VPPPAALALFRGAPAEAALSALEDELAAQGFARRPFEPAIRVMAALARGEAPPRVPPERWPRWLDELVRVDNGRVWAAVRVRTSTRAWPDGPPAAVMAAVAKAAPGAAVASAPRLGAEVRRLVLADFRRLVGWGAAVVAAVVLLSFRGRPRPALLALVPVTLGCVWTFGLAGLAGLGIDPFSIVVAPLLLGIGIDDGLHALHGARVHGGIAGALGEVGRAMTLTTLTTCAGFGSLAASRVPALARGGVVVAVGVALCLAATLWLLPAIEALTTREDRVRSARMPRQGER
jgi:predicted exporter